jgi:hypothetical protein
MQSLFRLRVFCIQLMLLGFALGAVAQDVQMVPDQQDREAADKAQSQKDKDTDEQPVTTFKANTNIVQLFFNVKDKKGGMIGNLPKDAFEVSEDGKPQTIKYFSAESQLPLTLGILIDSSASQERVLYMEQEVGGAFLTQILREKDMAFVMDFNIGVSLVQDFTSSPRRLKEALNSVKINSGGQAVVSGLPGQGGGPVPTIGQPKGLARSNGAAG